MYSGWRLLISGISLTQANAWVLVAPAINCAIMTVSLIYTEEKWLLDLYGEAYVEYKRRVNRCIPWKRKAEQENKTMVK